MGDKKKGKMKVPRSILRRAYQRKRAFFQLERDKQLELDKQRAANMSRWWPQVESSSPTKAT
uniref:Uncharacterized protein n=1 Tax=Rhizophora mucronata TaxID=61149 RepID=A0A2P2QI49_RHIMU